jgi:hypothetical protein
MQPEDIARMQKSGDVLAMPGKLTVQPTGPKKGYYYPNASAGTTQPVRLADAPS